MPTAIVLGSPMQYQRRFQLLLIKPSHYDDDGYVIRWWRAMIPSNSLAAVYGIAADCAERQVLGPDVAIDITVIDETNTRSRRAGTSRPLRDHTAISALSDSSAFSRTSTRALSISRGRFARPGSPSPWAASTCRDVCRCWTGARSISTPAGNMGIAMFAGEAEGRLDVVLRDAAAGQLAPVYDFMKDLPGMEGTPVPFLPKRYVARTLGLSTSFDAGRGCPVPVLVLHDHQRAGPQIALSFGRRHRASGAPQLGAGHPQVLHHRR